MQVPMHFVPGQLAYFGQLQQAAGFSHQQTLPQLPAGWELLYDPSGRVYYGCPSRRHVQWKFPVEGLVQASRPPQLSGESAAETNSASVRTEAPALTQYYGSAPAAAVTAASGAAVRTSVPVHHEDVEEVDAKDWMGNWYQAFIVKRDEKEALVLFSGWGKEQAATIPISELPQRIRARSASTATGQGILPSKDEVRKMFQLPAPASGAAELPPGWEVLRDATGKVYYGNRELKKVQWEHPSDGVSSGKKQLAAQYALSGAVHTIMSLRMRGKQIVPAAAETIKSNESNPSPNNNFLQKLTMWGTLISDLFKVVMACLLSVFVPQNCPPSQTFDKEYWHPCEVQENLTELDPYNSFVITVNFITCFACLVLYYAEYQRETFLIEYLDANPAESRSALDPVLRSNKYGRIKGGLDSHNRNLKNVALFTLIIFAINILVSGLLLFLPQADITYGIGFYLDGRTVTVFISNVLLLIMKLYDSVSLTRRSSKENKAISTALTEPVFFNVIDPKYLKH